MMTIRETILNKGKDVLNVYFTAGHPTLESTEIIIKSLEENGADIIELGMPYSDPLADGTTIQQSSALALKNGQSIQNIFKQVANARKSCNIPVIMMGYFNQMLKYGEERFLSDAHKAGIQGLIIPDMPMDIYERDYLTLFKTWQMEISFLITPLTSEDRIRQADRLSSAFVYVVSQSSITGNQGEISPEQIAYFERIEALKLSVPTLIGFGIHDKHTREIANKYSNGAIIGSAFIRAIDTNENIVENINSFITRLK